VDLNKIGHQNSNLHVVARGGGGEKTASSEFDLHVLFGNAKERGKSGTVDLDFRCSRFVVHLDLEDNLGSRGGGSGGGRGGGRGGEVSVVVAVVATVLHEPFLDIIVIEGRTRGRCRGERNVSVVVVVARAETTVPSGAVSVGIELAAAAGAVDDTAADVVLGDR